MYRLLSWTLARGRPCLACGHQPQRHLVSQRRTASLRRNQGIAEAGGLIGYGLKFPEMDRRAAYFVDRILKGVRPEELPVQQPTTFDLVINLKTAKALSLRIPQSLLQRAHR